MTAETITKTKKANNEQGFFRSLFNYSQFGLIIGLIILLIVARFITPAMFKPEGLSAMLQNNSTFAILAIGMMFVLLTGGIDLSVASTLSMTGVITSMLMDSFHQVPAIVWVLVAIIVGSLCGMINGFLIGKLKMVPMIATLGTMYIYRGLAFLISGSVWLFPHKFTKDYVSYAQTKILGIAGITWIAVIIFILAGLFLAYTRPGRRIFAIGTNEASSRIAGINPSNVKLLAYTLCGAAAGLAGMLYTGNHALCYYGMADGYELQAIAICILGGVSIAGGKGRVDGVVIGVLMMSVIGNFISMLPGLSVWQDALQGAIIIVAVAINIFTGRLSFKRALKERGALI